MLRRISPAAPRRSWKELPVQLREAPENVGVVQPRRHPTDMFRGTILQALADAATTVMQKRQRSIDFEKARPLCAGTQDPDVAASTLPAVTAARKCRTDPDQRDESQPTHHKRTARVIIGATHCLQLGMDYAPTPRGQPTLRVDGHSLRQRWWPGCGTEHN